MASSIEALIDAYIQRNGNNEISGPVLNGVLKAIVNAAPVMDGVGDKSVQRLGDDFSVSYTDGQSYGPYEIAVYIDDAASLSLVESAKYVKINGKDVQISRVQKTSTGYLDIFIEAATPIGEIPSSGEIVIKSGAFGDFGMAISTGAAAQATESAIAIGSGSVASAPLSFAIGNLATARNPGQFILGTLPATHDETVFAIGCGSFEDLVQKNAVEVIRDVETGDLRIFVIGVGGFDGTNPSQAIDIKTFIENMNTIKITGEQIFRPSSTAFSVVSPDAFTLHYSANGCDWTAWPESTPANETLMVVAFAPGTYFKLVGNTAEVCINF